MDGNTGHVVTEEILRAMEPKKRKLYDPLPEELGRAAEAVLKGEKQGYVSLTSGGKLSRYAARQRKRRRKMAKISRKRNRK